MVAAIYGGALEEAGEKREAMQEQTGTASKQKPVVLDMLVVGGGPAGTAAAFRARELGLKALVIDYDDLMKRIRDYSKNKLILPNFGGGDKLRFPKGGPLISGLHFAPIDKDDMCALWKGYYQKNRIPTAVGMEFTGLKRVADSHLQVQCWNHNTRHAAYYLTRHLVIAIGHGVPRRFDIPGNTEGIAFRLSDPATYVGQPACVIGGGTSAAEAVIAISQAKAAASDGSCVYWSYRGTRLPRVSKALAEVFFEAYIGNGNIRYYPHSEPASVVVGEDHRDYLSIRVDRRRMEGRPLETSHLEFPKENCLACIGEDIPEGLLNDIGIELVQGGPNNKKRMVVTPHLESASPNVYLIGDLLSQAYFETTDFGADPAGFKEIKHRGNIKSALRDGVRVAEVIKQKLEGKSRIVVEIEDAEEPEENRLPELHQLDSGKPKQPPRSPAGKNEAYLIRVLPGGVPENEYPLDPGGEVSIGRKEGQIRFEEDSTLEAKHASVFHDGKSFRLRDEGSATGTFLKLHPAEKMKVADGDLIRLGRQFLLFSNDGDRFFFTHYDRNGKEISRHEIAEKPIILGRDGPDINLDAEDLTLSRRHVTVSRAGNFMQVKDLKSANGTYLRVSKPVSLSHGTHFQVGQQKFLVSLEENKVLDSGHFKVADPTPRKPLAAGGGASALKPAPSQAVGGVTVTFANEGKTFPVQPGQTLCEVAEANGIEINAECHSGICGSDPIRILEGRENLVAEPEDQEKETLEDLCELEPGPCRLACMAKIKGPVKVEIITDAG